MNTARDFVVVDVETSGFDHAAARVLSVAALTITAGYKQSKHADHPLPDGRCRGDRREIWRTASPYVVGARIRC